MPRRVVLRHDPADRSWAEADPLPSLLLGPLAGILAGGFIAGAAWLFLPGRVTGADRSPLPPPRTTVTRTRWGGTMRVTESGTGLPGRLKLLLAGSGIALAALMAFVFLHGELSAALAHRAVSATVEGHVALRVKERRLIAGEFRPLHIPTIRFGTPEGREVVLDAEAYAARRGLSPGDPSWCATSAMTRRSPGPRMLARTGGGRCSPRRH